MRFLPQSLFAQITITLLVLLCINVSLAFIALRCLVIDPGAIQFANSIVSQLQLLAIELRHLDAQQASLWIGKNLPDSGYLIQQSADALSKPPAIRFYQLLQQQLAAGTHEPVDIYLSHNGEQSLLLMQQSWMQGYWLGIPFQSYLQNIYNLVAIVFAIITLLSIIVGYLIAVYLLKPLQELGNLAQGLAQMDGELPKVSSTGPKEVRQVSNLITEAATQMRQLGQDRELMLAGVSHDLRTPLARLRIAIEWMQDAELRLDMQHDIEEMDAIIAGFIDYTKAGQNERAQNVDIADFLQQLVNDFYRQGYAIELLANMDVQIAIRPVAINRLLSNLLGNAFKHGKAPVQIRAYIQQGQLQIWIEDCGVGIAIEKINALLEPFRQGNIARNTEGAGLGLAIAVRIAHLHHAELLIKNKPEGGLQVGLIFSESLN
ncbi:MAG: two-component system, OmpR family, osmolarity sensor histidine kinase EnvZ [Methyloprofundus sp.]|nr:MAG: two-component system, OmpR family, osmolarity sensor histidine kinase EnvZ [Methyloprofundus sp.]